MNRKAGFTLVEILIVIAIIALLASLVAVVGGNVLDKARREGTRGIILSLQSACDQYRAEFSLYPDVTQDMSNFGEEEFENIYLSGVAYPGTNKEALTPDSLNEDDMLEFNRRLRFMLEDNTYRVDEVVVHPFVEQGKVPKEDPPPGTDPQQQILNLAYVDAWAEPLHVFPGRDHTQNTPPGPNNFDNTNRTLHPLDIYSQGPNLIDDVAEAQGVSTQSTGQFNVEEQDDIVSWALERGN